MNLILSVIILLTVSSVLCTYDNHVKLINENCDVNAIKNSISTDYVTKDITNLAEYTRMSCTNEYSVLRISMVMIYCNDTINAREDSEKLKCLFYNQIVNINKRKFESLIKLSNGTGYNSMGVCKILRDDVDNLLDFEECENLSSESDEESFSGSSIEYSVKYKDHENGTLSIELNSKNALHTNKIAVFERIEPSGNIYTMLTSKMKNKTMCKYEGELSECSTKFEIENSLFVYDYIFGGYKLNISDVINEALKHDQVLSNQFVYNNSYEVILNQRSMYTYTLTVFKVVRHEEEKNKCYCRRVYINHAAGSWIMNCTSLYNRTCTSTMRVDLPYETLAVFSSTYGISSLCAHNICLHRNNQSQLEDSKAIEYEKKNPHRLIVATAGLRFIKDFAYSSAKGEIDGILKTFKVKTTYDRKIDGTRLQDDFFVRELFEMFPTYISGDQVIRRIDRVNVYVLHLPPDLFSSVMTFRLIGILSIYILIIFLVYIPICMR